ncbi:MAG: 2,3-bisphosphoglycerate-independent phosphoglycerate mutase [Microgenomates group bacterium]
MEENKLLVLIILDGWGIAPPGPGNAVSLAKIPNFKKYFSAYPHTQLLAAEEAVGLPPGEQGNSEAGHLNLGAGQIVFQDFPRINMAIADGTFFKNEAFLRAIDHVKRYHSSLHLLGLIGPAGVHASIHHLLALINLAKTHQVEKLYLHLFTDGRDSPPYSSIDSLTKVEEQLKSLKIGKIATLMGRYYAMDRDWRWERTKIAYEALVLGKGKEANSFLTAIQEQYQKGKSDEFLEPIILDKNGLINDNDGVIFYNFRPDRPRQLTKAFILPNFETLEERAISFDPYAEKYGLKIYETPKGTSTFKREKILRNLFFVTMTEYEKNLPVSAVAFPPQKVALPLARVLSENNLRQLHIAESEKYPHISYFFGGGREKPFPGEDWVEIPSPKVATYDLKPEMSAFEVTDQVLKRIKSGFYQFVLVNFANPDMVGHTGVLSAGIKACETVDYCLGKIVNTVINLNGICVVTADHGNVEEMINLATGEKDTQHSLNPVPFILINKKFGISGKNLLRGVLADVAPTILELLKIEKPPLMTGKSLLL